eukprot:gene6524-317_t
MKKWDTSGQKRFQSITSSYCSVAQGIVIVCDITNKQASFEHAKDLIRDIPWISSENFSKLLVGNKSDLDEARQVDYTEGKAFAESIGASFFETSAKSSGASVDQAFANIVEEICKE